MSHWIRQIVASISHSAFIDRISARLAFRGVDASVPTILRPDMKNRTDGETDRYFWTCYAGAQNDGKGCNFWKLLNMKERGSRNLV